MAEIEEITILRVDTGEAVKSVQDLRDNIKAYKDLVAQTEIGTKEYQDALRGLTENQTALRNAMHASTASLDEVTGAAKGLGTSYNALVAQMAQLKEEFRATNDAATRTKIGAEINKINAQLKDMDAQQGNFSRNVGNYTNSVLDAFGKMGGGIGAVINPIKSATGALQVMSKTPAIAVLGLLATALTKVTGALKSSEENTVALNKALAPLRALGDAATRTLQALGGVVVKLVEGFGKLAGAIMGTNDATTERIALAEQEANLARQTRETTIANAEAERDVAELRAKAADRATYSAKERIAFLQQAGELERQIADRAVQDAKAQYEIIKQRNALTKSSAAELKEEADAYAAMVRAETQYHTRVREINSGIASAMRQDAAEAVKAVKEAAQVYKDAFGDEVVEDDAMGAYERAQAESDAQSAANAKLFEQLNARAAIREEAARVEVEAEQALTAALKEEQDKQAADAAEAAAQMRKAWTASVGAVADVIGSLADIYEANADGSARAEERIKALRIASATIATIQGAIGAYMQAAASIPPPAGIITGAAQAATVTAAGLANIAKIRATSLSGTSTSTAAPSFKGAAPVAALPVAQPSATPSALATLASDTQVLNTLGAQRVYILASDIEASDNARKVRVSETTF